MPARCLSTEDAILMASALLRFGEQKEALLSSPVPP